MSLRLAVKSVLLCLSIVAVSAARAGSGSPSTPASQKRLLPEQLRDDLSFIDSSIRSTDPDLVHSVEPGALGRQMRQIEQGITKPMGINAAWRAFATLNPVLADGHLGIGFSDWRASTRTFLAAGGAFFPFEVVVDPSGQVRIKSLLGGQKSSLAGRRILTINGRHADVVGKALLARMHGDSRRFRAGLLSNRWWFFYWKMYGAPSSFHLTLAGSGPIGIRLPASRNMPEYLMEHSSFERAFQFQRLPGNAALLTLNTFDWPDRKRFYDFTRDAFRSMQKWGTTTLVVDVRQNGGGDDDMWMKGILAYIATKPYRWASSYEKRVIPHHRDPGQRLGEVVHGTLDHWIKPDTDNPLHYSGKFYVLIGNQTYSSAILFSNVVQDFKFGRVVGEGGFARTAQSGGIQTFTLPNTGLAVWSPRFILHRPSGAATPKFVEPDIRLKDDPFQSFVAIEAILDGGRGKGGAEEAMRK